MREQRGTTSGPTVGCALFSLMVGCAPRTLVFATTNAIKRPALTELREHWITKLLEWGISSQRESIDPGEGSSLLIDAGTRARTLSSGFEIIEGEHTSLRWVTSTPIFGNT